LAIFTSIHNIWWIAWLGGGEYSSVNVSLLAKNNNSITAVNIDQLAAKSADGEETTQPLSSMGWFQSLRLWGQWQERREIQVSVEVFVLRSYTGDLVPWIQRQGL
jgi:hypothetical protein